MIKVFCLDDGMEYNFNAKCGYEAMIKMLYYLNLKSKDSHANIMLCNGRTWCLNHNNKTYGCLV